jgi:excisionase family DNA binding protein
MTDVLLTVEQAAEQLKLHPKTVLRHIRDGRLPATRIGKSYRIERSRLDAFAGIAAGRPEASDARATCIVDIPNLGAADAQRIATFLGATAMTGDADTPPLHLSTAFDPGTETLKVVIVGSPFDAGKLLEMLHMQLDRR